MAGKAVYPDLANKVVVITGGSDGIGRATAILFARQKATVFIASRGAKAGEAVAKEITDEGGRCRFVQTDVTDLKQIAALGEEVKKAGPLSVLVNCAGGFTNYSAVKTVETSPEDWDLGVKLNLTSVFYCCRELVKLMTDGGSIINISSNAARKSETNAPRYYAVSKAAVQHLTKVLATELAPAIRVNSVAPGTTRVARVERAASPERMAHLKKIPRGKLAEPEEIAAPILFLASEEAAHITGITLDVSGGQIML